MGAATAGSRERLDTVAFWALVAFVACVFTVPAEWIPALEKARPALVTSGLAAALMVLGRFGRRQGLVLDGARGISLAALVALAVGSVAWSVNPAATRETSMELVKLLAIYVTVVNVVNTPRRLTVLAGTVVLASIVTSIGVINWHRAGVDLVEGFRSRWVGVYADPNHMAMDLGLVIPLALAFLARKQGGLFFRLACMAAAGLAVTAIVLSHSRGGSLGLVAAVAVWALREHKRRLVSISVGTVMALGLILFAPQSFWERNETVTSFHEDASAMGRVYAWEVAAEMSRDNPLVGVGAGAFRYAWPIYAPPEATHAFVAHNVFLDVVGELGWIGLCLFLVFVGGSAAAAFQASTDAQMGWLARGIFAALVGYVVCDLFSGYILSTHFYLLFGLAASARRVASSNALARAPGEEERHPDFAFGT